MTTGPVARPLFRRLRYWLVLAAAVLLGAVAATLVSSPPGRSLDPDSASHQGSRALARLLGDRGTRVRPTTSVDGLASGRTVLVAFPQDYTADQLRTLATGRRLIMPASTFGVSVLAPDLVAGPNDSNAGSVGPQCDNQGARAAGEVRFPAGTQTFTGSLGTGPGGAYDCFGGRVFISGALVVIGPASALTNARLADRGVAALDLNAITDNGAITELDWLLPGPDAHGAGSPSIWQLLPAATPRAVGWVVVLGVLVVIWRSRRMGPVVYEPLPVVVRAAEIVEGHGRLYRRAHARNAAATTLRQASKRRLAREFGLPPDPSQPDAHPDLVAAVAARTNLSPAAIQATLTGANPATDAQLIELAQALSDLETSQVEARSRPQALTGRNDDQL